MGRVYRGLAQRRAPPNVFVMARYANGRGDGVVTDDGCPVELYARLRARGEPELVASAVPAGASILDLGAGTGRLAHPLAAMGYKVIAVDQSAEMLAHLRGVEAVHSTIGALELEGRTFQAVLLASYLFNTPITDARAELLRVCRRYVEAGGALLCQVRSPSILQGHKGAEWESDGVRYRVESYLRVGPRVSIELHMELGERRWVQSFTHEFLTEDALRDELLPHGFTFARWLDPAQEWFSAVAE